MTVHQTPDEDILDEISKEGKEGDKNAKEYFTKEQKREDQIKQVEKEILESANRSKMEYHIKLAELLIKKLNYVLNIPGVGKIWTFKVEPDKTGVVMEIYSPEHRIFRSAFKPTGIETFDYYAVENFVIRAENTVDKINGQTKGGIILP